MRKKWVIIIPTVVAFIAAWFFTRHGRPEYVSMAELSTGYVSDNLLDGGGRNQNNSILFGNVLQTLQSKRIIDRVSYELLLHDLSGEPSFRTVKNEGKLQKVIGKFPGGKSSLIVDLQHKSDSFYVLNLAKENDRVIQELAALYRYTSDDILSAVLIFQVDRSDFIRISSTTENADLSAFIPNAICKSFLDYYNGIQKQTSSTSIDTLRSIVVEKKQILDNKLKLLSSAGDFTTSNSVGMLETLQNQLAQERNSLIASQVALEDVDKQLTENDKRGGLSNNEEIINLRNNIDNLWTRYINGGSTNAALLEQINGLRNDLQKKLSAAGAGSAGVSVGDLVKQKMDLNTKINISKRTIAELQQSIGRLNNNVLTAASKQGIIQGIQNDVDVARQEYIDANNRYNEAINRNIFPGNNFKQSLVASPPISPEPSKKLMVILFAGVAVFFFVVFLILFFEFIDPNIKAPSVVRERVDVPLLANFPKIDPTAISTHRIFSSENHTPELVSEFQDRVRQLRYDIKTSKSRVILLTSCKPDVGKTLLMKSLAKSFSLSKNRVLLIDANFKDNRLTEEFGASNSLEEIFSKENMEVDIEESVEKTEDHNIDIIGCRGGNYTPDEIISKQTLSVCLEKSPYDYVLIEGGALMDGPGARELTKLVDGVVVVLAADQPLIDEEVRVVNLLKDDNLFIGAVLNRIDKDNMNL
jgi:uncharacterized protein involved in exopolysaccharide biosynthesis/Mrp family chromosome partitioning ATPase